ncbi:MAG: hypothetical protein HY028_02880 [Gammaproteobacteria bacterium]|nr:hypothetical protein [Gammaproteobacteria bacterium]
MSLGKPEFCEEAVAPAHPCARDIGASMHGTVYTAVHEHSDVQGRTSVAGGRTPGATEQNFNAAERQKMHF